uniref:Uncharacterized protein n=1 Tax=Oryza glumipatula TaxID=40148 RepID=A0A0E0A9C8_9ORYZ
MDLIKLMPSECLMKCLKGLMPPWPPPIRLEQCKSWEIRVAITLFVWKKQQDLSAKHPFISYMMAQYFETIEQRRVSVGNSLDINIFQDTWGCKDGIQIILKEVENARDKAKCNQEYNFSMEECFNSNHQIILGN